jgi:hypothetical protein
VTADLRTLTEEEFSQLPRREQARAVRAYGRSVGIDMSERTSRQLASKYDRQREAQPRGRVAEMELGQ